MMTRGYPGRSETAPQGRRGALALVLLAHVGALLWVLAMRTVRLAPPDEQWVALLPLAETARPARPPAAPAAPATTAGPARDVVSVPRVASLARPPRPAARPATAPGGGMPDAALAADPLPHAPFSAPLPGEADAGTAPAAASSAAAGRRAGADLLARALAAAGAADRAERHGQAAPLSAATSPRQKLAAAIDAATASPRLWQAPRITQLKDNTGYGRQIYKVETGLGTYCIVAESNHALDGRDVIRDGLHQKTVSCPAEF